MTPRPDRYIERSFPIAELNPLSVRERNAFKPIYKMHKWFARRSSSIFRAVLLGAALPFEEGGARIDIMDEFYRGHADDPRLKRPDGKPLTVLDPFMGGGTTVVEALRLGFDVIGVDYNPIAWFIVKGETTPVDLDDLAAAFERVSKKVKDELLALYRTRCPVTQQDADIIYAFWVKQGVCVDPKCRATTDLFKSYEVARKRGDCSLDYLPDVSCPGCRGVFDWELDRCTITAGGPQVAGGKPAGKGRPVDRRWAFGLREEGVDCPHCGHHLAPSAVGGAKPKTKSVPLHVLVDPSDGAFFEVRGDIPEQVTAPVSGHTFEPNAAPVFKEGQFACRECGRKQAVVESARTFGQPLPFRYYGFYAFTDQRQASDDRTWRKRGLPTNNGKWFAAVTPLDLARVEVARRELDRLRDTLPLPTQPIEDGYNTNRLVIHQYRTWADLYGPRQLLALGKLLTAIAEEPDAGLRDAMLGAFQSTLNYQSNLARYNLLRNQIEGVTSAHDFRNPTTIAENPAFGIEGGIGRGTFRNYIGNVRDGIRWSQEPTLTSRQLDDIVVADVSGPLWRPDLSRGSSTDTGLPPRSVDLVITDPPYAGSVQYAEMSDWSYVWLHHVLKDVYPDEFGTEITLKSQEIIEDGSHKDAAFFFEHLTLAWRECHRVLKDDGLLCFTFHHKEGDRWTGLLRSLFDAGFTLVAAYPTHSEALNSIVIQATKGITYDIIHVCRKRPDTVTSIPWTRLRAEVQRESRQQLKELEQGGDVLPGPDVWMILLGKALRLFSQHYGAVLDYDGSVLDLDEAMERIRVLVREVRGEALPLPGALQDVDSLSQIALIHLAGKPGWTRDGLHIELKGYAHGIDKLLAEGLIREVRGERGKLEPVPALERYAQRQGQLGRTTSPSLIDLMHLTLGVADAGEPIPPALRRARGRWRELREGLAFLGKVDPSLRELTGLVVRAIDAEGPDMPMTVASQIELFEIPAAPVMKPKVTARKKRGSS